MKIISIFLLLSLGLGGCSSRNYLSENDLEGRWGLESATRNGKVSPALEGVFFEFKGREFKTNFPYPDLGDTYTIEEQTIVLEGNTPLEMYVRLIESDKMSLDLSLKGSDFTLIMNKETQILK